jgi:hypothetical protein
MALKHAAMAGAIGIAALLAGTTAFAQTQSPTAPRRPDCSTYSATSEAYRDCLAGRAPRDPSGRLGTSPDTLHPTPPGTAEVPGATPGTPGMAPSQPGSAGPMGTPPTAPGTTPPSGGTAAPGR